MNNLNDVWRTRFNHYINELQKYMRFIFTGHMALVIVFLLGAGGYQYSQWLNSEPQDFPTILVVSIIMGIVLMLSKPVTLIKAPDMVYLLPLERQMAKYFNKALNYTLASQMMIAIVVYIVMWPMLNRIEQLPLSGIAIGLSFTVLLKWWNIHVEFMFRWALEGRKVWSDRLLRGILSAAMLYTLLQKETVWAVFVIFILAVYPVLLKKKTLEKPFPYEPFVTLEESRMMMIYRVANYFTNVPQIKGSIKRRAWLDFLYKLVPKTKENTFEYYLFRSFVRTDDHFYLWVRLTLISALVAAFAEMPIVIAIVSAALAFATAIQIKQGLTKSHEFSMSMLYPVPQNARSKAATKVARYTIIVQAMIVLLSGIGTPYFYLQGVIVLIVGEITLRLTK